MTTAERAAPDTFEGVAEALAQADCDGVAVRIAGAGTKPWTPRGTPGADGDAPPQRVLATTGLDRILAHDPGDMTASLQAGVPLAQAQAAFADSGQMLALDPPLAGPDGHGDGDGDGDGAATIGGIVAAGDAGPLAHRYGNPRDLVVGATFALADGTVAKSGGTVIKNVAGYDIARLLCGSFGTLGVILSVNVRLHPRHPSVTVRGAAGDPATLARAGIALSARPAELECLDVAWADGAGRLLARVAGPQSGPRSKRLAEAMRDAGLDEVTTVDGDAEAALWADQRGRQRSADAAVMHLSAAPSRLAAVLGAVEATGAGVVGRAATGRAHVTVAPDRVAELRARLPAGTASVLRDCPADRRGEIEDPWGETPAATIAIMRAVKDRFDPLGTCNPGTFVGGI